MLRVAMLVVGVALVDCCQVVGVVTQVVNQQEVGQAVDQPLVEDLTTVVIVNLIKRESMKVMGMSSFLKMARISN